MADYKKVKAQIEKLISDASVTTGKTIANLTEGVEELISGYGQGSGGSGGGEYTVKVIDYDGTVLLEEQHATGDIVTLPNAPTHNRLVFDGWSATVGVVNGTVTVGNSDIMVGAMYYTASGATEIDIVANKATGLTMTFHQNFTFTSIDWGDGTTDSTSTHTYSDYGEYTVKIYGATGLNSGKTETCFISTSKLIKNVFVSKNATTLGNYALGNCDNMECITLHSSITSLGSYSIRACSSLSAIIIPSGITSVENNTFEYCYSVKTIVIPSTVKSIGIYAFQSCYNIKKFILPLGLTTIKNNAFHYCYTMKEIVIPSTVTSIGSKAFYYCYSLQSIVVPQGVTSMSANIFEGCYILKDITLHSNITSIGDYSFARLYDVKKFTIPSNVTSIGNYAFRYCGSCKEFDFSECKSVPTLGTSVFDSVPKQMIIKVPASLYNTWIAATNWSTYANHIVAV
jgi:hypothetical protein